MKKLCIALSLAAALTATNMFASMTAILNETGPGNATGGGIFQAVTSDNGTFDTFCISINTEFQPGDTYNYSVSPTIVANPAPVGYPQNPPTYISYGTAYIYNQFELGNPTYAGGATSSATANAVQYTIWYLQGLLNGYSDPRGYDYTSEVTAMLITLETQSGKTLGDLQANGDGAFGVEALDLHDGTYQPQLIQVPVPEASTVIAGALLVLPFAASTVRILRKSRLA
ncbi:MAG TPA: hypothetical protein VMH87_03400 [Pseudomonadales bacterium]|nr:hypothetical protein [Pseudomonadales bacterium]